MGLGRFGGGIGVTRLALLAGREDVLVTDKDSTAAISPAPSPRSSR